MGLTPAQRKKIKKLTTSQRIKMGKPLEVWETRDGQWRWEVYKKYQKDDSKPRARWFTKVKSPFTPEGEIGDTYVSDVKAHASKILDNDEEE